MPSYMSRTIKDPNIKAKSPMNGIYLCLSLISDHYSRALCLLTVFIHPSLECSEKSLYHIVLLHLDLKEGYMDTNSISQFLTTTVYRFVSHLQS